MNPDSISSTPPTATLQSFDEIPPVFDIEKLVAHFHRELDRNCLIIGLTDAPDSIDLVEAFTRISTHPRLAGPDTIWSVPFMLGEQFSRRLPEPCFLHQYQHTPTPGEKYNRIYVHLISRPAWIQLQPATMMYIGLL